MSTFSHDNNAYVQFHLYYFLVNLMLMIIGCNMVKFSQMVIGTSSISSPLSNPSSTSQSVYFVSTKSPYPSHNTIIPHTFTLWHNRLDHPSLVTLNNVLKLCDVPTIWRNKNVLCVTRYMGKFHKNPSSPFQTIYSSPLARTHILWSLGVLLLRIRLWGINTTYILLMYTIGIPWYTLFMLSLKHLMFSNSSRH